MGLGPRRLVLISTRQIITCEINSIGERSRGKRGLVYSICEDVDIREHGRDSLT